ncbi:ketosteroid isomerase-related protein [Albibacillus kandeliae]|uniref:ketosteroid isomerase-related protein n=1 Tax=Albibacillus kandeliae TaxID=2174228 RepID=UPI000D68DDA3|nr:ketosteroid isomerase-related protein [Albibacillus kandeliae]
MSIVETYFKAFNAGDTDAMLDCLTDDVAHHVNEGKIRSGKALFKEFNDHMTRCYKEELTDMVIFEGANGTRAAAEFIVNGTYLATDSGLPEAKGQTYRLPGGSFFDIRDGKIARVTTYYNLADWIAQVS